MSCPSLARRAVADRNRQRSARLGETGRMAAERASMVTCSSFAHGLRIVAPLRAIDLESSALIGPPILLAIEASMNSSMVRRVHHASAVG